MKIFIPSKWRAWKITTLWFIDKYRSNIILVVEPEEVNSYKNSYPNISLSILEENWLWIWYSKFHIQKISEYMNEKYIFILDDDFIKFYENRKEIFNIDHVFEKMIKEIEIWWYWIVWTDFNAFNNHNLYVRKKQIDVNRKIIQMVLLNIEELKKVWIYYDKRMKLYEDVDFQLKVIISWLNTLRMNYFCPLDFSFMYRKRKKNTDKLSWAWLFWEQIWVQEQCIEILENNFWKNIIKKRLDKSWRLNFTTYFHKIW